MVEEQPYVSDLIPTGFSAKMYVIKDTDQQVIGYAVKVTSGRLMTHPYTLMELYTHPCPVRMEIAERAFESIHAKLTRDFQLKTA